nr:MAG TPA: hypothetical protein [Caudoviricetes sp.]
MITEVIFIYYLSYFFICKVNIYVDIIFLCK